MRNVPMLVLWLLARLIRRHGTLLVSFFQPSVRPGFRTLFIRAASTSLP
jgi:hypothetical protein